MNAIANNAIFASAYRQLSPSERMFVDGLVVELERAANRANERISLSLYRPIPDHVVASSRGMLEKPLVTAAITERVSEIAAATELTHQRVLKELMSIGFSSMGDYMRIDEETGQPVFDLAQCTPEQLSAIKKVEIEESGTGLERGSRRKFKFELHDKMAGLKMLAEFTGVLKTENPFWRQDQQQIATLEANSSPEEAQDIYAAYVASSNG